MSVESKLRNISGSLYPERVGDGRDGAGDQHDRDHHKNRRSEQVGKARG